MAQHPAASRSTEAATRQLHRILAAAGLSAADTGGRIAFTGADPVVPSRHRIGATAAAAFAAQGAAIAAIWRMRSGRGQDVSVDLKRAVVPGLQTSLHISQNGAWISNMPRTPADDRIGFVRTGDGRSLYILCIPTYAKMMMRLSSVLGCGVNGPAVRAAALRWPRAEDLEEAIAEAGAVGVMARTPEEWRAHPQGRWLATQGPVELHRLASGPPEPFLPATAATRPLSGIRVLDLGHVLAGPVTGRLLAEQGADVLHVHPPWQLDRVFHTMDTGAGKREANIDLEQPADRERLRALLAECDVVIQSFRPGHMETYGFGPEQVARIRPGIVYASVSCYGQGGPWATRGGYEMLGQTASGFAAAEGSPEEPKLAPGGYLADYLTPSLLSAGILGALLHRAREGGSWHVTASLTRSCMFALEAGPLDPEELARMPSELPRPEPEHMIEMQSPAYGLLRMPAPVTVYSETAARWDRPPAFPGSGVAEWLPR